MSGYFLANLDPLSLVTLCHTSRYPQSRPTSHISDTPPHPIFCRSRPSTKNPDKSPLYKFSQFFGKVFVRGVLSEGYFSWKVLSGMVFVRSPSVRIHLLQQKCKHHSKFHVSYV